MPSKSITSKQQQWLRHGKAADTADGSLTDYASRHDLSVKALYQWKIKLITHSKISSMKLAHESLPGDLDKLKEMVLQLHDNLSDGSRAGYCLFTEQRIAQKNQFTRYSLLATGEGR